jgi:hypothetical protein
MNTLPALSMRLGLLLVSTVVIALAVAPAAGAEKPTRTPTTQPDMPINDQCAFPVLAHWEGTEIDTTFVDKAGPVRLLGIFPGNKLTLTNLWTGKSITLPATGSFHLKVEPDGSESISVVGNGLSPVIVNVLTGESGIWYLTGRLSVTVDSDGNPTSISFVGKQVNLCAQLAS